MFKDASGITEFSAKSWKSAMAPEEKRHRNLVVFFYDPSDAESKELKSAVSLFVSEFVQNSGLVQAGAVNCARQASICQKAKAKSPAVLYYGPGDSPARMPNAGRGLTSKGLSSWVAKTMTDFCKVLSNENDLRRWLSSDDKVPHAVFFTDRKSAPPLLKALSIDFSGRAALGIVLGGGDEMAKLLSVTRRPTMVHVLDEDSLEVSAFDKEFKKEQLSRFLSRAVGKHRSQAGAALTELTAGRLRAGHCAPGDSNFCLLHFCGKEMAEGPKTALRQLAQRLQRDPVKVFFVRHRGFAEAFGASAAIGSTVLYRPKRKRYKLYSGASGDLDALASFVDGAVGGGAPLPEALQSSPSMGGGDEL